ncbi:MAG: DUF188 domain-containing protein [Vallitaleaceae bacterium]|jgi:uncharacterized protein YaiI (UPF0178 family)|nr:DUF188 domain-containing protein [Vallitaleaceae bacterium]
MRIIIDGDACPSKTAIKSLAQKNHIPVHVYVDSSHVFTDDYFEIHIISQGKDAVDMAIANSIKKSDILITQDYGLASITMLKCSAVVNPVGYEYTLDNIDQLLMQRHINQKNRRAGKRGTYIKKRTSNDETKLIDLLETLIKANHLGD